MKSLRELIDIVNEAAEPGRAWNGKLKRIDELMSWLYANDILNKTDKAKKDRIFNQYYRYYNNGDVPRGKDFPSVPSNVYRNLSRDMKDKIEKALEDKITNFISEILKKYNSKFNRKDFSKDRALGLFNDTKAEYGTVEPYYAKKYIETYGSIGDSTKEKLNKMLETEKLLKQQKKEVAKDIKDHFKGLKVVADIVDELWWT